jgi:protein phosphatase PTC1
VITHAHSTIRAGPVSQYLLKQLNEGEATQPIPDLLNATFHVVDGELSKLAAQGGTHSGCTAVTAFLRLEDEHGNAVELEHDPSPSSAAVVGSEVGVGGAAADGSAGTPDAAEAPEEEEKKRKFGDGSHRERIKSLFGGSKDSASPTSTSTTTSSASSANIPSAEPPAEGARPPAAPKNLAKRTLYTANVGDARAVLR